MSEGLGLDDFGSDPYGGMDELIVPVVDTATVIEALIASGTTTTPTGSATVGGIPDNVVLPEEPVLKVLDATGSSGVVFRINPIKEKIIED